MENEAENIRRRGAHSRGPRNGGLRRDIDYQEFQEDPLETAIRKLAVPDGAAWDKEVMLSGGAPDIVQEIIWPLRDGYLGRGVKRTGRRHDAST